MSGKFDPEKAENLEDVSEPEQHSDIVVMWRDSDADD